MNAKERNLLVWVIVWAVLLLAMLYSPIGSPDLYTEKYFQTYNGVDFNGTIENSSAINAPDNTTTADFTAAPYSLISRPAINYSVSGSTSVRTMGAQAGYVPTSKSSNPEQISNVGGGGGMMMPIGNVSKSSKKSDKQVGLPTFNIGVAPILANVNLVNSDPNTTVRMEGDYTPDSGGPDPGDDNLVDEGAPIGDGTCFLIFLSLLYFVWKRFF